MSAEGELQTAIYNALNSGQIAPVHAQGDVPDNASDKYIVIGNDTMIEWDTDCETGFEGTVTIHAWDTTADNRSFLPVKDIMGDVYAILHRAELSITGYNTVGMDFEFSETFLDPDGLTRHGVQRFRVLMRA